MKSDNAPCGSWTWSMTPGYASATFDSTESGPAVTCTSPRRVTVGSNDADVATTTSFPRSRRASSNGASCANTDSPDRGQHPHHQQASHTGRRGDDRTKHQAPRRRSSRGRVDDGSASGHTMLAARFTTAQSLTTARNDSSAERSDRGGPHDRNRKEWLSGGFGIVVRSEVGEATQQSLQLLVGQRDVQPVEQAR